MVSATPLLNTLLEEIRVTLFDLMQDHHALVVHLAVVGVTAGKWTDSYIALFYSTVALTALYTTCISHTFIQALFSMLFLPVLSIEQSKTMVQIESTMPVNALGEPQEHISDTLACRL